MLIITIKTKHDIQVVQDGRLPKAHIQWRAPGLEVYTLGSMNRVQYEGAANLAMNYALAHHIPAISLKKVSR